MITKQQLAASFRTETDLIKHLGTKITGERLEWKPTPGQRSLDDLMRYVTVMAEIPAYFAAHGEWGPHDEYNERGLSVTLDNFAERMDEQCDRVTAWMLESDFEKQTTTPWGSPTTTAEFWLNMVGKCFTAYRMQLFLYLKQSGRSELGSANLWIGVDQPAPVESE